MDKSTFTFPITFDTVEYTLITLVRNYPELYNPVDEYFNDKERKDAAWTEIAKHLNKEEQWCVTKWNTLTSCYKARKRKVLGAKRWPYDDVLSFLAEVHDGSHSSADLNMINANLAECELTSSGSGPGSTKSVTNEVAEDKSPPQLHPNCFDETLYHSLDEITEKAKGNHNQFGFESMLDRPSQLYQSSMKRKNPVPFTATNKRSNQQHSSTSAAVGVNGKDTHAVSLGSASLFSFGYSSSSATAAGSSANKSKQFALPTSSSSTNVANTSTRAQALEEGVGSPKDEGSRSETNESTREAVRNDGSGDSNTNYKANKKNPHYDDCPHYHFCMSLVTRFRKMDEASALFTQMKIMELLLKNEFPLEYNRRMNEN